jgi:hypothetical protein
VVVRLGEVREIAALQPPADMPDLERLAWYQAARAREEERATVEYELHIMPLLALSSLWRAGLCVLCAGRSYVPDLT